MIVWRNGPGGYWDIALVTNAAGIMGYGFCFQGQWSAESWIRSGVETGFQWNLVLLVFFQVVLAMELGGGGVRELDDWVEQR